MKHFDTVVKNSFQKDHKTNCGECMSSCQSACKTSCTVGNQTCKQEEKINTIKKEQI